VLDAALRAVALGEISPQEALDLTRLIERRQHVPAAEAPVSDPCPEVETGSLACVHHQGQHEHQGRAAPDLLGDLGALGGEAILAPPPAPWEAACKSPVSELERGKRVAMMSSVSPTALAA
jgi:hypothetical protein